LSKRFDSKRFDPPMRPTITDVAAAAEVSISTVSLVVNGKGPVSETTRSRVLAAVERLGYAPSRPARELATRRTGNVGFVLREDHFRRSEPFYTRVFLGAEFEARLRGTYVLLSTVPDPYDPAADAPRFLTEHSVDGVVVAGGVDAALLEQLGARQIPHVLADFAWGDTPAVAIDNAGGAEAVATHFAERGYARAVFLGAELDHPSPAARRDASTSPAAATSRSSTRTAPWCPCCSRPACRSATRRPATATTGRTGATACRPPSPGCCRGRCGWSTSRRRGGGPGRGGCTRDPSRPRR